MVSCKRRSERLTTMRLGPAPRALLSIWRLLPGTFSLWRSCLLIALVFSCRRPGVSHHRLETRQAKVCRDVYVSVKSKLQHPPPGQSPGHLNF